MQYKDKILQLEKDEAQRELQDLIESISMQSDKEPPKEYEELIQKLEGDVRMHIMIEQQMKLHSEDVQEKLDEKEKELDQIDFKMAEFEKVRLRYL